jgi:hypothetical protein
MDNHKMSLTYNNYDDGIWLECDCRFNVNLGFDATPANARTAELLHHTQVREAAAQARQCCHVNNYGRASRTLCEVRADWEGTGPDGSKAKACDDHIADMCHFEGATSVIMLPTLP